MVGTTLEKLPLFGIQAAKYRKLVISYLYNFSNETIRFTGGAIKVGDGAIGYKIKFMCILIIDYKEKYYGWWWRL
jgi:hypothetical protein